MVIDALSSLHRDEGDVLKKLLYIHDFPFRISAQGHLHFEVGMPEKYFDRFVQAGFEVDVFSRVRAVAPKESAGANDASVRISRCSRSSYFRTFFSLIFNRKRLNDYHLVVINYPSINGLFWLSLFFRKPYILEHVNDNKAFSTKLGGALVYFYLLISERFFFRRSFGVTSVAPYLVSKNYPENYIVASNVDIAVPEYISRCIKQSLTLISVGAVSKKKGIDLVFKQLSRFEIDCRYKIIGEETDLRITELSANLPNNIAVEYLGVLEKEEVFKHLIDADIYLQGSRSEGLPRAVIEAMAYSLPVIASRLACYSDLLDGEWLIDFNEDGALWRAVRNLLERDNYQLVSQKNYNASKAFDAEILRETRAGYYKRVSDELHAN